MKAELTTLFSLCSLLLMSHYQVNDYRVFSSSVSRYTALIVVSLGFLEASVFARFSGTIRPKAQK